MKRIETSETLNTKTVGLSYVLLPKEIRNNIKISALYPRGMLSPLFAFKTQMIYSFGRISLLEKYLLTLQEFLIIACTL